VNWLYFTHLNFGFVLHKKVNLSNVLDSCKGCKTRRHKTLDLKAKTTDLRPKTTDLRPKIIDLRPKTLGLRRQKVCLKRGKFLNAWMVIGD
jgi:hypothetical protein